MQFSSRNLVGFIQLQISKVEEKILDAFSFLLMEKELERRSGFYVNILSKISTFEVCLDKMQLSMLMLKFT